MAAFARPFDPMAHGAQKAPDDALPDFDEAAVRSHVTMIHELAAGLDGTLLLVGFEENPRTGAKGQPRVLQFKIGDVDEMVDAVMGFQLIPNLNVFAPMGVYRKGLPFRSRGEEKDLVALLALVVDQDADTGRRHDLPVPASYELETSAGNRQPFFIFDRPLAPDEAKPLAAALHAATRADFGTKDIVHVWRIPGTLNWPTKTKLARGRDPRPQLVQVARAWDGDLIAVDEFATAVQRFTPSPTVQPVSSAPAGSVDELMARLPTLTRRAVTAPAAPGEDRSATAMGVIASCIRAGMSDGDIIAVIEAHPDGLGARYVEGKDLAADVLRCRGKNDERPIEPWVVESQRALAARARELPSGPAEAPRIDLQSRVINPTVWEGAPVPPREWIVPEMIPARTVTLLAGEGAAGKSTLALQLAVARALGKTWLATSPRPGRTLVLSAEDDGEELHRRVDALRIHFGARFSDLGDLRLVDLVGEEAVLGMAGRSGIVEATGLLNAVTAFIGEFGPDLVIVDALADAFAGDENNRGQARQFIGMLKAPARKFGCAFLCLAHPSLTGLNNGTGASGSTAWGNSVRSRIFFEHAKATDGSSPDKDLRSLTVNKTNYGPAGITMTVKWEAGAYVALSGPGALDRMAMDAKADEVFLKLLAMFQVQGQDVSPKPSLTYAPIRFAKHPDADGFSKQAFEAAMQRLLRARRIRIERHGPPSKERSRIVLNGHSEEAPE